MLRAEVIIYDDDNETVKVISVKPVKSIALLKNALYRLAFLDFFGENELKLHNWKIENRK